MAEGFKRYQRSEAVNPGSVNLAAARSSQSLSDRLSNFANQQSQVADEQASFEGGRQGKIAGAGKISGVQMQDDSTIRGRAFNQAALLSNAAQIQIDVRTDVADFFRNNQFNVLGFDDQVEKLKKGMLAEVDPSLRPHVETEINDYASRSRAQIQDNVYTKEMNEFAANIHTSVEGMREDALQAARLGDADMYNKMIAAIAEATKEGIEQNVLDPVKVAAAAEAFNEEIDKWIVIGTFDKAIKEGDLETLERQLETFSNSAERERQEYEDDPNNPMWDFHDSEPLDLKPDTVEAIKSHIRGEVSKLRAEKNREVSIAKAQQTAKTTAAKDQLDDFNQSLDNGSLPNIEVLDLAIQNAEGTEWADELRAVKEYVNIYQPFIKKTIAGQQIEIAARKTQENLTGDQAANIARLEKAHLATIKRVKEGDGLSLYYEQGFAGNEPPVVDLGLLATDPDKFAEHIKDIKLLATAASAHYGIKVPPMLKSQANKLLYLIKTGDIQQQQSLLAAITYGFDDQSPETIELIFGEDSSPYAVVGGLMLEKGNYGPNVAQQILLGIDQMKNHKNIIPKGFEEVANNIIGNTYVAGFNNKQHKLVLDSAKALYAQKLAERGSFGFSNSLDNVVDSELMKIVLDDITNGFADIKFKGSHKDKAFYNYINDEYRIELPRRNMNADQFEEWLDGITAADIDAMGGVKDMDSKEVAKIINDGAMRLVSAGDGKYKVNTLPNNSMNKPDGSGPFILDYSISSTVVKSSGQVKVEVVQPWMLTSDAYANQSGPVTDNKAVTIDETEKVRQADSSLEYGANTFPSILTTIPFSGKDK